VDFLVNFEESGCAKEKKNIKKILMQIFEVKSAVKTTKKPSS
jgi:hypothetical protein